MVTIGDMLARAEDFEMRLERFYADLRDRATSDGVRLLTYYLARHRKHLPEAMENFDSERVRKWKRVLLKYDDTDFDPHRLFSGRHLSDDVTADQLLAHAIELVEHLIRFYRWMTMHTHGKSEQQLFEFVLRIEENHVVELKKMKAMDYF